MSVVALVTPLSVALGVAFASWPLADSFIIVGQMQVAYLLIFGALSAVYSARFASGGKADGPIEIRPLVNRIVAGLLLSWVSLHLSRLFDIRDYEVLFRAIEVLGLLQVVQAELTFAVLLGGWAILPITLALVQFAARACVDSRASR